MMAMAWRMIARACADMLLLSIALRAKSCAKPTNRADISAAEWPDQDGSTHPIDPSARR
jgi:hypothetical protein